ncbi:hypothetical protein GCM10010236_70020 [Streptomyces eurythermus]|nr:hypothetical protein GCM10010236_70020 [Streptomyces eurythermus]
MDAVSNVAAPLPKESVGGGHTGAVRDIGRGVPQGPAPPAGDAATPTEPGCPGPTAVGSRRPGRRCRRIRAGTRGGRARAGAAAQGPPAARESRRTPPAVRAAAGLRMAGEHGSAAHR